MIAKEEKMVKTNTSRKNAKKKNRPALRFAIRDAMLHELS
jgi:hypothetical protein